MPDSNDTGDMKIAFQEWPPYLPGDNVSIDQMSPQKTGDIPH